MSKKKKRNKPRKPCEPFIFETPKILDCEIQGMNDVEWVENMCHYIYYLFKDTQLELCYRNGHAHSRYLKFVNKERFPLQVRVSNHECISLKTKYQVLRSCNSQKVNRKKVGEYKGYPLYIYRSASPTFLAKKIIDTYFYKGNLSQRESDLILAQVKHNFKKLVYLNKEAIDKGEKVYMWK